ncbi:MAG: hypothetical protein IPM37_15165 [Hahellaceae bacterium]|nr:hypothetical protein [Hahellaceae bacterium]
MSQVTSRAFDALNRLISVTEADTGVTKYDYDAKNRLVGVTDAEGLKTTYEYDYAGNRTREISPNTGTTSFTFDSAGNRLSKTDARGVVTNYKYDAENRLTHVTYPADVGENITYSYDSTDQGNFGKGRLTGIVDSSGSTRYFYDDRGNVVRESRTIESKTYETRYAYDLADKLTQITYPSGRQVKYTFDSIGQIQSVATRANDTASWQTLASDIRYLPFGPMQQFTLGNGLVRTLSFDQDYRLNEIDNGVFKRSYDYDLKGNITGIQDLLSADKNQSFQYDSMDRLTDASGRYGELHYSYDHVGNRLTRETNRTGQQTAESYSYAAGTQRLTSITSTVNGQASTRSLGYDAAGNRTQDNATALIYNQQNRLESVEMNGQQVAMYLHNALGQRVIKVATTPAANVHFHYDRDGLLLAETNNTGQLIREYVYLNGAPIAVMATTANTPPPPTPTNVFGADSNGLIVIETEHFHDALAIPSGHYWSVKDDAAYAGAQGMEALPEDTVRFEYTAISQSPRLDYRVQFPAAGTYYIWVRGMGPNGSSDSLHLGLNGTAQTSGAALSEYQPWKAVLWGHLANGTSNPVTISVPSAGVHTLNVWMRESGMVIDRMILTQASGYVPSGNGPGETLRAVITNSAPEITSSAVTQAWVNTAYAYDLTATDGENDTLTYRLVQAPANMTITQHSGQVRWTPSEAQRGNQTVVIEVSDGQASVTQSFEIAVQALDPAFRPNAEGLVVMEAEHYDAFNSDSPTYRWQMVSDASYAGSNAMQALPEDKVRYEYPQAASGARIDFEFYAPNSGTYYVWVRGLGPNTSSDSVHVGLNGAASDTSVQLGNFYPTGSLVWSSTRNEVSDRITVQVTTPGIQSLNVWMRESGTIVDRILVTQNSGYTPSGTGPAESTRN